jgi:hypothetical protein
MYCFLTVILSILRSGCPNSNIGALLDTGNLRFNQEWMIHTIGGRAFLTHSVILTRLMGLHIHSLQMRICRCRVEKYFDRRFLLAERSFERSSDVESYAGGRASSW